ncbi:hypothetical protein KY361_07320 [Candidatus Woesearchaeota archaeon]|nr:hypothetical protein [Candidatus Woesearchaeota archaeon]
MKKSKKRGGCSVADLKKQFKGVEGAIKFDGNGVELLKELRKEDTEED